MSTISPTTVVIPSVIVSRFSFYGVVHHGTDRVSLVGCKKVIDPSVSRTQVLRLSPRTGLTQNDE